MYAYKDSHARTVPAARHVRQGNSSGIDGCELVRR
jgi:hypothetical protein